MAIKGFIDGDLTASTWAQLIMMVMGGVYTFACIRSFTFARKAREAAEAAEAAEGYILQEIQSLDGYKGG